ncbi:Brix domain-containing protein [Mycena indigotica]|uniref:Ribosome production factor 2 homolog n=1 Tax=Mycena indigotica TaxID=2126181 RepID=A0A8H6WCF9_9AGAR|nr:Brix domain-containing protein [Mycena indigotica]KAF7309708.1 Brix domain-containing protein [Mycena indigotica]
MLRTIKPKNARSKRALEARQPKEVEDSRTTIFVKGTHTGQLLNNVMRDLMTLKRPDAISFSKKNAIHPFEDATKSTASLEFWAQKNDASMFVIGHSSKKRPHGLTFVRMFDYRVLDMLEVGIENCVSMPEIKTPKSTPGNKPLMHFASDLFDTNPRFTQLKSMLISLFNGEVIDSICLAGLEHVISVSLGPSLPANDESSPLPTVHLRTYTTRLLASGTRTPRVELISMGPSLDMKLRRHTPADAELFKTSHAETQTEEERDLSKLQTRKMKGLNIGVLVLNSHLAQLDAGLLPGEKLEGSGKSRKNFLRSAAS